MIRERGLRLLASLHRRGFHPAVVAAVLLMPTVALTGYLTRGTDPEIDQPPAQVDALSLRPSLTGEDGTAGR